MKQSIENNISTMPQAIKSINEHLQNLDSNMSYLQYNLGVLANNVRPIAIEECNKAISTLNYNDTFDKMLSITENTIATAGTSIAHVDSSIVWYLGGMTLLIAFIAILLQWLLNKDKEAKIKDAINNILDELSTNDDMRDQLIKKIFEDNDFKQRFDILIRASLTPPPNTEDPGEVIGEEENGADNRENWDEIR